MKLTTEHLPDILAACGETLKSTGPTTWSAKCPVHNGKGDTSLSIDHHPADNRVYLKCWSGCGFHLITEALGIKATGPRTENRTLQSDTYIYHNADGTERYRKRKYLVERPDRTTYKSFSFSYVDEHGEIFNKLPEELKTIYNMPAVAKGGDLLWIVEGEKCVTRLGKVGHVATSMSCGAQDKWKPVYTEAILNAGWKRIMLWPDNDDAGFNCMDGIMAKLLRAGAAQDYIGYIQPRPANPQGWDSADYVDEALKVRDKKIVKEDIYNFAHGTTRYYRRG